MATLKKAWKKDRQTWLQTCNILGCNQYASDAPVNKEIGPVCEIHEDEA